MKGIFEILELSGKRLELAIELLKSGNGISFHNVGIQLLKNNIALIFIPSQWQAINLTEKFAIEEINNAKSIINEILSTQNKLSEVLQGRKLKYVLYEDYGMGGIDICEEINGTFKWLYQK
jgi:hypothetical protein